MKAKIVTSKGDILIQLEFEKTPMTVANFIGLAEGTFENTAKAIGETYFDGLKFHRVIKYFMIQGGDPNTRDTNLKNQWGMGGPGYNIKAEFNPRSHLRGIISMARSQDPDSAGSQFFIVTSDSTFLDREYTVFGEVTSGLDIADKIVTDNYSTLNSAVMKEMCKLLGITKRNIVMKICKNLRRKSEIPYISFLFRFIDFLKTVFYRQLLHIF